MKKKTFKEIFINAFWDSVFLFIIALFCTLITPGCTSGDKSYTNPTSPTDVQVKEGGASAVAINVGSGSASATATGEKTTTETITTTTTENPPTSPLP